MDDMDDLDVRDTVRTAGTEVTPEFRAAMRDELDAALRGETGVTATSPAAVAPTRRGVWLAAAAAVVVVGVVATVIAVSDDDRGTLTPGTVTPTTASPTSAVPTTEAATTEVATTVPPTTVPPSTSVEVTDPEPPSPDPAIPLLSVDASFAPSALQPVLAASSSSASSSTRIAGFFQGDGWTSWTQLVVDGPITVSHYALDGTLEWDVPVPAVLSGRHQVGDIVLGPLDVLYAYYESADGAQVAAVPTSGARAGDLVATWLVPNSCYETGCGPQLGPNGLWVSDTQIGLFVDANGRPAPNATFQAPQRAQVETLLGPAMPEQWVKSDENGFGLISQRTTVTLDATSWTFDAVGVLMAGDYFFLRQYLPSDGGVLVWFTTSDGPGSLATRNVQYLGRLRPDGSQAFVQIPVDVTDAIEHDGRIYVTTYDAATRTFAFAEVVVG